VTGIVAYLTEECLDTCNKHDHNKHKIAALLLFFSPLWGFIPGAICIICLIISVIMLIGLVTVGPFVLIYKVLKKNTD
jgi:uncharacterized membrane protein